MSIRHCPVLTLSKDNRWAGRSRRYSEKTCIQWYEPDARVYMHEYWLSCSYIRNCSADQAAPVNTELYRLQCTNPWRPPSPFIDTHTHTHTHTHTNIYSQARLFSLAFVLLFLFFVFMLCERAERIRVAAICMHAGMLRGSKRGPCPGQCCIPAGCTSMHTYAPASCPRVDTRGEPSRCTEKFFHLQIATCLYYIAIIASWYCLYACTHRRFVCAFSFFLLLFFLFCFRF